MEAFSIKVGHGEVKHQSNKMFCMHVATWGNNPFTLQVQQKFGWCKPFSFEGLGLY